MSDKVLLALLRERTSAKGTRYLSGYLGKARLVAFLDRDAPEGEVQWQVFAQVPDEQDEPRGSRGQQSSRVAERPIPRRSRQSLKRPATDGRALLAAGELDDPLPW